MKKNKKKAIILSICLIILCILVYEIMRIYAVFYTEATGNINMNNAKWNVEVNDVPLKSDQKTEFLISDFFVSENAHVKPGNIAPGTNGFFLIKIDPKDTEVSVRYDITLDRTNFLDSNIIIKSITETQSGKLLIKTDKDTYSDFIKLEDIQNGNVNEIKVEIDWLNGSENQDVDTEMALQSNAKLQIPVVVQVTQYLGEELVEYVE